MKQQYRPMNIPRKYQVGACTVWNGKTIDCHARSHFFFARSAKRPLCPDCGRTLQATTRRYQGEWFLLVDGVITGNPVRTYETAQEMSERISREQDAANG
jgi:hypothetical protein